MPTAGSESRELLDRLKNSDTFHVMRYVNSDHDMNDAIIAGKCARGHQDSRGLFRQACCTR